MLLRSYGVALTSRMSMNKQHTISLFRASRKGDGDLVVAEGVHAYKHALRFGADLEAVYVTDMDDVCNMLAAITSPREVAAVRDAAQVVDKEFFVQLAPNAVRTGLVALARRPQTECTVQSFDAHTPVVFLENPHDTENVGAVVRVAAGYGTGAVVVSGSMYPWNANSVRASAGLHWALPVCGNASLKTLAEERPIVVCTMDGQDMYDARVPKNAVLVFGTERYGVTDDTRNRADMVITIPMQKHVSSLNLATSVSAVLYGAVC